MKNIYNIVIVVCHPDDEVLWIGGLISGLSQYSFINITVICLSGKDDSSPRIKEFYQAQEMAKYKTGIIMGGPLRKATEPLPEISKTLEEAFFELNMDIKTVDCIITHPPYGDEHQHPHHIQAFYAVKNWSQKKSIAFGFFSFLTLPMLQHQSFLKHMACDANLHIVNISSCKASVSQQLIHKLFFRFDFPKYYLAFSINKKTKLALLNCYQSIDVEAHLNGYAMSSCAVEGLYLYEKASLTLFYKLLESLPFRSTNDVFIYFPTLFKRIYDRVKSGFSRKTRALICRLS